MLWPGNHRGSPWDGTDGSRRLYEVSHDNDCLCVVPTYNNNEKPCFGLTAPSWPSTATTPTSSRTLPHHCEQNISMVEVDSGSARVGSGAGGEATLTRRQPILPISRPGLDSTTGRVVEGGDAGCERSEQEEVMVGEAAGTWTGDRLSGGKSHAKAASRRVGKVAEGEGEEPDASMFSCNICMEMASHAVVTMCGHLYCWPCLYRWLQTQRSARTCPVCKAGVDRDKVIPVYGRGGNGDPRNMDGALEVVPPRPLGQRPLPVVLGRPGLPGGISGSHVAYMPSIGLFRGVYGEVMTPEQQHQAFLSRLLLMLGSVVIVCLLFM